jgi:NOL1/NOP2/sun family putative RNA methylase
LDPKPNDRILDMCAAPGTKTYIISFMTNNKASITANDIDRNRAMRLNANAKKYGIKCSILNQSGRTLEGNFNKILIDAPCSGEGMVNKKDKLFKHWSEKRIKFLAKKQKKLVNRGFDMLDDGGTLVYSTCTFAPEENEAVIDFLLAKNDNAQVADIDVPIVHSKGVMEWNGVQFNENAKRCMRIYPNQNGTGGFFVAKIRKVSDEMGLASAIPLA